ncbi:acetyl-CoA synthetase-like protein [Thelephora ganbajun]|uniref:Acetyl-CoA synthetase-like protein n=1 Tax=Thelephora ganbajun TaxID=370292 RepID=A0ACB6Z3P6_THEGA|nr:acetyl-CoA synthetase-like protein [Thelephora ganbajun]
MIEHRLIVNLVQNSHPYGYRQGARVLSSLVYTFDPFVADVFGTLSCGATLVTGRKELVLGDIGKAIKSLRIDVVHCTPGILAVVPLDNYPTLETVVVAGETLGKKLIEDWSKRVKFMNMYGPTEASVDCVHTHVTDVSLTGVIGRPLPNNRLYILNENLRPTPIGVEGELFVGGIQLARGYLNQPEQTEKSFIPNPFVPGERLYRTGDVTMYRTDGNIVYCGRKDRQIKLRGQRIELGEIEDVINKYKSVQRAAVLVRNFHNAPAVIAFVELKSSVAEDHLADEEVLKMHIPEHLPRSMYPSLIAHLPVLPTSTSGKVSRRELMELDLAPFQDTSSDIGLPQSDVEVTLHKIFSEILKTDPSQLGVTHDLFSIGLNSLLAVQAAAAVGENFKLNISLNNIYLRPTIRELSNVIIDAMGQDQRQIMAAEDLDNDSLIELLPIKRKGIHPRMFIVHDITGMATPFMRLGAYMPNEMWAIGDKYFGSVDGFTTVEEMADHYITLIRGVQPHGPYVISGYSMGGLVALVIADKLKKAGEVITHLIIFDTIFIPARERQSLKSSDWTARAIDRISENFPEIGEKWKAKLWKEIRKNLDAMWELDPPHYDGPTTLVVPKDRVWYRSGHASDFDTGADDLNGWEHRLSNLAMKVSPGRHDTIFMPAHVKGLAVVLKEIFAGFPIPEVE